MSSSASSDNAESNTGAPSLSREFGILGFDSEGKIAFADGAAARLLGHSVEDIIGLDSTEVCDDAAFRAAIDDLKQDRTPTSLLEEGSSMLRVATFKRRSAGYFPAEFQSSRALGPDYAARLIVTFRDVTTRDQPTKGQEFMIKGLRTVVEMAEELMECEDMDALYRRAVELPREKLGVDRTGLFLEENDVVRSTYGTDKDGHTVDESAVILPKDSFWQEYFRVRMPSDPRWSVRTEEHIEFKGVERVVWGKGWVAATPVLRTASRYRPTQPRAVLFNDMGISGAPFDPALQEVVAVYCSMLGEIIERKAADREHKRLEAELLEARRTESLVRMAGGIAHDFNNLLLAVLGNADLLLHECEEGSSIHECAEEIKSAGMRAADLSRMMLAFSGHGHPDEEDVDVNRTVNRTIDELDPFHFRHVDLELKLEQGLPSIVGDAGQLKLAVHNLLVNASESIKDEGAITIRTSRMRAAESIAPMHIIDDPDAEYVVIEVSDTGCGMDNEVQEQIFDPFYSTKFVGRGLGLAAVAGIVRAHMGDITVKSMPGKGSVFTVLLPSQRGRLSQKSVIRPPKEERIEGAYVLVVDDEESVRRIVKNMLEDGGFVVMTARDGREAVEVFKQNRQDISAVLLDMTMPNMDGETAFCELRKIKEDVPIIVTSGYSRSDVRSVFPASELAGFIQKPYRQEELLSMLWQAFAWRSKKANDTQT